MLERKQPILSEGPLRGHQQTDFTSSWAHGLNTAEGKGWNPQDTCSSPRAMGTSKPSVIPEERPRNTPTTCSQGPRLWSEDVILAPKPLALSLPRDFSVLTRGPVNRTFCPNQPVPPTPFWAPCPGKVFQAFPGSGSHPGACTRKCWKSR